MSKAQQLAQQLEVIRLTKVVNNVTVLYEKLANMLANKDLKSGGPAPRAGEQVPQTVSELMERKYREEIESWMTFLNNLEEMEAQISTHERDLMSVKK